MAPNDGKSYLRYFDKLEDECNDTYHRYSGKKYIHADYSFLIEEIDSSHKVAKFKVGERVKE